MSNWHNQDSNPGPHDPEAKCLPLDNFLFFFFYTSESQFILYTVKTSKKTDKTLQYEKSITEEMTIWRQDFYRKLCFLNHSLFSHHISVGKTANHCVVMARLKMQGQDCGMQSFVVQIRDLETHQPLPGRLCLESVRHFGLTLLRSAQRKPTEAKYSWRGPKFHNLSNYRLATFPAILATPS